MIQTILLAIDGSACSDRALHFTASLARTYHTRVVLVYAYIPVPEPLLENRHPGSMYESRDQAEKLVQQAARRLRELGIAEVETEIVEGPAVNVIIGAAETYRPDILVIGARGQSLWPGSQLGSVSMAVTQRVECPVLVVR